MQSLLSKVAEICKFIAMFTKEKYNYEFLFGLPPVGIVHQEKKLLDLEKQGRPANGRQVEESFCHS